MSTLSAASLPLSYYLLCLSPAICLLLFVLPCFYSKFLSDLLAINKFWQKDPSKLSCECCLRFLAAAPPSFCIRLPIHSFVIFAICLKAAYANHLSLGSGIQSSLA